MKSKLFISIFYCLFSFNSFSQKVTYNDLKGKWQLQNTPNMTMFFNFIDAKNIQVITAANGASDDHSFDTAYGTYQLDTSSNSTKLILFKASNNVDKNSDTLLIKIDKLNILKCQKNTLSGNWDDLADTLSFAKVKEQ
ncbi:hypothetical protein [Ferruginibacter albus]|uniref:hypothetical protein n=1 Tax=Ferruginibacter albus TaxID=2875540 RepID=UPI001CC4CE7D|nr:hypothetical protein [Ferruginibacter albus]UAY50936.1 hypothetical protein K9M53_10080 [Ferruginibacter albus]